MIYDQTEISNAEKLSKCKYLSPFKAALHEFFSMTCLGAYSNLLHHQIISGDVFIGLPLPFKSL